MDEHFVWCSLMFILRLFSLPLSRCVCELCLLVNKKRESNVRLIWRSWKKTSVDSTVISNVFWSEKGCSTLLKVKLSTSAHSTIRKGFARELTFECLLFDKTSIYDNAFQITKFDNPMLMIAWSFYSTNKAFCHLFKPSFRNRMLHYSLDIRRKWLSVQWEK